MAIENTYLLGKNIILGCGFDLQAKAPLDSRQTVPVTAGLQALIDGNAAYEGMIVYDEQSKKTYQAQLVNGTLTFREFGINEAELKELIAAETTAAMEFKGATAALPENPSKGDMWKVAGENINITIDGVAAKVGDSIVYNGEQWFLIPSGDDIEDTWRPVTDVANDATLTFVAGDKLDVAVASNGTITYKHEEIDAPTATPVGEGEQTRTYITAVQTDGHGHITGYKTATENVEDTNTEYTFEGQGDEATSVYFQVTSNEEGAAAEVVYLNAYSKNEANNAFKLKRAEALAAVETGANEFIDTIAQDTDGNITVTTKTVDFTGKLEEVTGENAIEVIDKSKVTLKIDSTTPGNVELTQSANGLKANIDLSNFELADTTYTFADGIEEGTFIVTEEGGTPQTVIIGGQKVSAAKAELIGAQADVETANTIYGAKKYADKAIENANLGQYAKTSDLGELATADNITAAKVTDFATEVANVKVTNATNADNATNAESANKVAQALTIKVGGADVVFDGSAAKTADVDTAIQAAINEIPDPVDYSVTITETTDGLEAGIAKKYTFTQRDAVIGTINLAKELVVTSGTVKEVTINDMPYAGAKVGDKYIELVIANQTAPIYIPAKDLVDIYTAKGGAAEVQVAISNTNEISATLVEGGITEAKLHADVKTKLNKTWEEVGVAQGLVDALANGQVKTNKEAIENITKADGLIATAKAEAIEAAKSETSAQSAVVLSEAQKYTDAAKAELVGYLTWGTF